LALPVGGSQGNADIMTPVRGSFHNAGSPRRLLYRSRSSSMAEPFSVAVPPDQLRLDVSPATDRALDEAIAALESYLREKIIPAAQVINPLLDVWSAAKSIDPSVALPVEDLLTTLVSRSATTPSELLAALDDVRIAAAQAMVLVYAVR
jgi:hypothetical protein